MKIKGIIDEDFVNYKKPSLYIAFPNCSFKCGRELCQNSELARQVNIEISIEEIYNRYINNPITKAIVCGGLEPMDSLEELFSLIQEIRKYSNDDIIIYSGYEEDEVLDKINQLRRFSNIIIKFGRYVPEEEPYFNEELGVTLIGKNQYTVRYK